MKKRKDPPGYPGDQYITRRFYEMIDELRESAGMTRRELQKAILAGREEGFQNSMRRAMGIRFRAVRERRSFSRIQLADLSNIPAREIGRIERGRSDLQIGDMVRLCLTLNYDIADLLAETWPAEQKGN